MTTNKELYTTLQEANYLLVQASRLLAGLSDEAKEALYGYFPKNEDVASLINTCEKGTRSLVSEMDACNVIFDGDEKSLKHIEKPYKAASFSYDKNHQHEKVIFVPKAGPEDSNCIHDALTSANFVDRVRKGTDADELQETAAALFSACEKEHPDRLLERHGVGFFRPAHDNDDAPSQ